MKGQLAFEKFGDILPHYILESAPHGTPAPSSDNTSKVPFYQRHSGLVAALICGVLAVGIYLGILFTRPNPTPVPPLGTTAETEMEDVTEGETATETVVVDPAIAALQNYANPYFVVETINGQAYLNPYNGDYDYSTGGLLGQLEFESIDALFKGFYLGQLTEQQRHYLLNYFPRKAQGYPIPDISKLYEPVIPQGGAYVSLKVSYRGIDPISYVLSSDSTPIKIEITSPQKGDADAYIANQLSYADKSDYLSKSTYALGNSTANAYTYASSGGGQRVKVYVLFPLEANEATFVRYEYIQDPEQNITSVSIEVHGYRQDCYFEASQTITNPQEIATFMQDPSTHLNLIDARAYTPIINQSNTAFREDHPYTVQEVDGITYIQFEDWDGTLPASYAPASTDDLGILYFSSPDAMYNAIYGNGLSTYQRILLKSYPQTPYGVALGDTSQWLFPTQPSSLTRFLYYYIIPGESMGAVAQMDTDTMVSTTYFKVLTAKEWASTLASLSDTSAYTARPHCIIHEGSFGGVPCIFYEYADRIDYYEVGQDPRIFCHFTVGEGKDKKEIFWHDTPSNTWFYPENSIHLSATDIVQHTDHTMYILGEVDGVYYQYELTHIRIPADQDVQAFLAQFAPYTYTP